MVRYILLERDTTDLKGWVDSNIPELDVNAIPSSSNGLECRICGAVH